MRLQQQRARISSETKGKIIRRSLQGVVIALCLAVLLPSEGGLLNYAGTVAVKAFGLSTYILVGWLLARWALGTQLSVSSLVLLLVIWMPLVQVVVGPLPSPWIGAVLKWPLTAILGRGDLLAGSLLVLTGARFFAGRVGIAQKLPRREDQEAGSTAGIGELGETESSVLSALENLGYARRPAERAVRMAGNTEQGFERLLKESLKALAQRRV